MTRWGVVVGGAGSGVGRGVQYCRTEWVGNQHRGDGDKGERDHGYRDGTSTPRSMVPTSTP